MSRVRQLLGATFLLFLGIAFCAGCSSVEKKETIVIPVDNGEGVPGVVVIHKYDEDAQVFEGLLLDNKTYVTIKEEDVSGGVLLPRNRALELLSKEGALSLIAEQFPELTDKILELAKKEEDRIRSLAK